jgi:hypothetical protein
VRVLIAHTTCPAWLPAHVHAHVRASPCAVFRCVLAHMGTTKPPYSGCGIKSVKEVLETISRGDVSPVAHMAAAEDGHTAEGGKTSPVQIAQLARECTQRDPALRPTFESVAARLCSAELVDTVFAADTQRSGRSPDGTHSGSVDMASLRPIGRLRRGKAPQAGAVHWGAVRSAHARGAIREFVRSPCDTNTPSAASPAGGGECYSEHAYASSAAAAGNESQLTMSIGRMFQTFTSNDVAPAAGTGTAAAAQDALPSPMSNLLNSINETWRTFTARDSIAAAAVGGDAGNGGGGEDPSGPLPPPPSLPVAAASSAAAPPQGTGDEKLDPTHAVHL